MTDEVDTCTEVDAQVAVLELEIRHLVHNTDVLGAHVEAKLRTGSKIDASSKSFVLYHCELLRKDSAR